jgi:acetate---CoA ligase (ADP-forming) subunit beta
MILPEHEAKELLKSANIPVIPTKKIESLEHAEAEINSDMGYPVVLKLSTGRYSHKTEIGGVFLNIQDKPALTKAFKQLARLREELDRQASIIVEPMAPAGAELFIGAQRHQSFGPVISFGVGGVWLELFKDVTFRLLPAKRSDLQEMLSELKTWPKLRAGFRNLPPANPEHVIDLLGHLADFFLQREDFLEIDLNPIMAYPDHSLVVDARIVTT